MKSKKKLKVRWGKPEGEPPGTRDILYDYPTRKGDGALLYYVFQVIKVHEGRSLVEELKHRGFDISTLKFSIELDE